MLVNNLDGVGNAEDRLIIMRGLTAHNWTQTDAELCRCDVCSKAFLQRRSLS